jgi:hypothetical protein
MQSLLVSLNGLTTENTKGLAAHILESLGDKKATAKNIGKAIESFGGEGSDEEEEKREKMPRMIPTRKKKNQKVKSTSRTTKPPSTPRNPKVSRSLP